MEVYPAVRDLKVAKDTEYRDEILLVATDHRPVFKDLSKKALQRALQWLIVYLFVMNATIMQQIESLESQRF